MMDVRRRVEHLGERIQAHFSIQILFPSKEFSL